MPATLDVFGLDCPVPPAVWREFYAVDQEVDLILELRERASPPVVANILLEMLTSDGVVPDVVTVSRFVIVSVTMDELVAGILPLTCWQDLMVRAGELGSDVIAEELEALDSGAGLEPRDGWEIQDLGRFRWLMAQLVRVFGLDAVHASVQGLFDRASENALASDEHPIETVGINRDVVPAVAQSRITVKADAAERVFEVDASAITWAVVDSGIDPDNIAFLPPPEDDRRSPCVVRAFDIPRAVDELRQKDPTRFLGLVDEKTWEDLAHRADCTNRARTPIADPVVRHHGTHVAGILAGDERGHDVTAREHLVGVCPTVRLVDINVFDAAGRCEELWVLVALRFIRWMNETAYLGRGRRIDGANLSISTRYDVDAQACGWTPICEEAETLVDSGVVVVAAAGNQAHDDAAGRLSLGTGFRFLSITDPGNAESVITVGATDKRAPHRFGPIAGSGRGPTADGRHKPDLLAPGNRIVGPSFGTQPQEMTGTSQAAPHVSGVAAMLLARFPELRGRPRRVKDILCDSATDLGRLQDFQGAGLVDALRALQRP